MADSGQCSAGGRLGGVRGRETGAQRGFTTDGTAGYTRRTGHPALQSGGCRFDFATLAARSAPIRNRGKLSTPCCARCGTGRRQARRRVARAVFRPKTLIGGGTGPKKVKNAKRTHLFARRLEFRKKRSQKRSHLASRGSPLLRPAGLETTRGRLQPGHDVVASRELGSGAALAPRLRRLRQGRRHVAGLTFALSRS